MTLMPEASKVGSKAVNGQVFISVVIPVLNEEKVIGQCLSCLERQSVGAEKFEIIVVDNGSVDGTLEAARAFEGSAKLTILQKTNCNISAMRNFGAAFAKGTFLAFLDADCFAPPQWLGRAVDRLRCADGGVVGAFYTIPEDSSWVARAWYGDLPTMKSGPVHYVPSGSLFVSRSLFLKLSGFDETIETSEDFEFCQRVAKAGYRVLAFPALSTVHVGTPQTLSAFYRKQRWHGNGVRTAFLRNMLDPSFAPTILQTAYSLFCMIAALIAIPLSLATGKPAVLGVAPALLLIGSFLLAVQCAAKRKKWNLLLQLTILYLVYGMARAVSLIGITGRRSARTPAFANVGKLPNEIEPA
jgi:glycosyltransferase involved in cell wall biosynthesis